MNRLPPVVQLVLRTGVSVGVVGLLAVAVDLRSIGARLTALEVRWVGVALLLSVVQVAGSAWRWRYTLHRLGGCLPFSRAVAEYYLATFLNQLLPGGVAGDVSRAWRHSRYGEPEAPERRRAVSAVILERASGQLVMTAVALVSGWVLLSRVLPGTRVALALACALAAMACGTVAWRRLRRIPAVAGLAADAGIALFAPGVLPVQLLGSLVVVASYVALYLAAAAALGVTTPPLVLLPLVAPVLLTMLLPVSVAGWGIREAAAAALWGAVGLTAADGVAISLTYGVLVLVSSLPGAAVLILDVARGKGPGRRGGRSRAGSAEREDATPGPASGWVEAGSQADPIRG